jgi:hypothetical protein
MPRFLSTGWFPSLKLIFWNQRHYVAARDRLRSHDALFFLLALAPHVRRVRTPEGLNVLESAFLVPDRIELRAPGAAMRCSFRHVISLPYCDVRPAQ